MRTVRTGFDQWFEVPGAPPPPAWKQNMVVLLVLYPLVFLLNEWLQKPILVGIFGLPYWAFLFINNAVSVVMLSLILPPVSRQLGWWLRPADHDGKRDLAGALLVACLLCHLAARVLAVPDEVGGTLCCRALVNPNANSRAAASPFDQCSGTVPHRWALPRAERTCAAAELY